MVRNLRLHYGGKWVETQSVNGVEVFNWIGGSYVDINDVYLHNYTMKSVLDLATSNCPNTIDKTLCLHYMIGGLIFDLNSNTEVQFLWKNILTSLDMFTHIYCEGTPHSLFGTQVSIVMNLDSPAKNTRSKTNLRDVGVRPIYMMFILMKVKFQLLSTLVHQRITQEVKRQLRHHILTFK